MDDSGSGEAVVLNLTAGTGGDAQDDTYASIERVVGSAYGDTLASSTSGHTRSCGHCSVVSGP